MLEGHCQTTQDISSDQHKFTDGHYTVKKTKRVFSAIPIDQAHEQNNARIKGDGEAVDLTEDPSALRWWMVAGPKVARVISEFESAGLHGMKGKCRPP